MGSTAAPEALNIHHSPQPAHELTVLATVAHELRGPLTALAQSSELLAEDFLTLDPDQIKRMLGAMHRRTLWLQGLVENLLCADSSVFVTSAGYGPTLTLATISADSRARSRNRPHES